MKLMHSICAFAAAATLIAGTAVANTPAKSAKADVPFEFVVNGNTLPAGQYTFMAPNAAGVVSIQEKNRETTVMTFGTRVYTPVGKEKPQLVFVKKDGKMHLSQVLTQSSQGGVQFQVK